MIADELTGAKVAVAVRHDVARAPVRARRLPKACTIAADCAGVVLACGLAMLLATAFRGKGLSAKDQYPLLMVPSLPLWIVIFSRYGLYRIRCIASPLDEFRRIVHAVGASVLALAAISFLLRLWLARSWLILFFITVTFVVTVERQLVRAVFSALRRRGRLLRRAVIVGTNREALAIAGLLVDNPVLGYEVVGFVDDTATANTYLLDHKPVLGRVNEILAAMDRTGAACVIVASTALDLEAANRLMRQLNHAGCYVELSLSLRDVAPARLAVRGLGHFQVASVGPVQRSGWRGAAKRALDVAGATLGLLLTAPVLLLIALAIKLDSKGPVLFSQERIGQDGNRFRILKFRSMVCNAEKLMTRLLRENEADGPLFKLRNDPRVTRVGRFLRRFSLDELPQLWNVLRGEMSLVGPRPALPHEITSWSPELHDRLRVKPGITGMWQVNGRSDASFEDYARLDLYYVDNWSFLTDITIVGKTVISLLRRQGAY